MKNENALLPLEPNQNKRVFLPFVCKVCKRYKFKNVAKFI